MDANVGSAAGALLRSCSSSVTFCCSPPVGQIGLILGLWAAPPGIKTGYLGGNGQIPGRGYTHPSVEPRKSLEDDRFRAIPAFVAHTCRQFPALICPAFEHAWTPHQNRVIIVNQFHPCSSWDDSGQLQRG